MEVIFQLQFFVKNISYYVKRLLLLAINEESDILRQIKVAVVN